VSNGPPRKDVILRSTNNQPSWLGKDLVPKRYIDCFQWLWLRDWIVFLTEM
jgi:hypothetical protein